ncbi:hypothetical protein QLQ80_00550 [Mycoplasma sp. M5725]|uniref:Uncharacterized protein n=1 Tax=Mycoplasma phocimorsus TaxID=3045839 RepID=A0AAJ1UWL4_9MOLU|nr:hypothetical protein [Mycoplasma phocimorsus]MDJ1645580.1 hypothetical protein [Mycoplasma phocimorsus]
MKLKKVLWIGVFSSISVLPTIVISCQKIKNNRQESKKEINNKIKKLSVQHRSVKLKNVFATTIENTKLKNNVNKNVQLAKVSLSENKESLHQKNTKWISRHPWISLGLAICSTFVFLPFTYILTQCVVGLVNPAKNKQPKVR